MTVSTVRVYLCTYRRNQLLRRAVASLLAQSFTDWVCELHNDDPADPVPAELVADLNDPRITVVTHPTNFGPTRTFNLVYAGGIPERYVSLLEDDNWWDERFLGVMVAEMDRRPDVQLAWANMRFWDEGVDGSWRNTGRCVWDLGKESTPVLFGWPHPHHVRGALHSNGAMLVRTAGIDDLVLPDTTPFSIIEAVRERRLRTPALLCPEPLANYALTRATSRGNDRVVWGQSQALLAASFFRHVRLNAADLRRTWTDARESSPPATGALIAAGLIDSNCRHILRYSRPRDWIRFAAGLVRRPISTLRVMRAKAALPMVWEALDRATQARHERAGKPTQFAVNKALPLLPTEGA